MELTEPDGVHDKARARRDRDALVPVGPDVLEDDVLRRVSDPHELDKCGAYSYLIVAFLRFQVLPQPSS